MSTARMPRPLAGLFAGVLPLLLSPCSLTLFILQHGGWSQAISILSVIHRPWGLFFWFSTACALGVAATLYFLASGRDVPLLLPVTLSLMPWLVGVGLALYNAQEAIWALGALALGAGVLAAHLLTRRPRELAGLAALAALALLVSGTLWADSRPLPRMARRLEAVLRPHLIPEGLRLLPFGGNWPANEMEVVVTAHELTSPEGTRVAWSVGDQALIDFMLRAYDEAERRPHRLRYKRSLLGRDGWRTLAVALDDRMTTHQLRRLLAASSSAKLHTLNLLTKRDLESRDDVSRQLRAVIASHPFLRQLGALMDARPGEVQVYLPLAFEYEGRKGRHSPVPPLWVGEVGAEREVRLSPWPSREGQQEVVLPLSGPEEGRAPRSGPMPRLYLHVKEEAALIDVAHAVRRAHARGFQVVLTVTPPPAELPEP